MTSEEYLRSHFEARCKVKQRYRSAQAATGAARFKEVKAGHPLYIYRCPVCAGWHLTKNSKKDYDLRVFTKAMDQALGAMLISRAEYDTAIREFKLQQERR